MATYLKKFDTHSSYEEFIGGEEYITPNVSVCVEENDVHLNDELNILTFFAEEDNSTISLNRVGTNESLENASLMYSTNNGGTWNNYTIGDTITLNNSGDSVKFKGTNTRLAIGTSDFHKFVMSGKFSAKGDVTSLFNNKGGDMQMSSYSCLCLFYGCGSLTKAPMLPATKLSTSCYFGMFRGCSSLTTPPELPATTLANECYAFMFRDCTSLTSAPELPATTLADYCYYSLFENCSMIELPPELPSETMCHRCYEQMFKGCTSLTTAPELLSISLVYGCYTRMFNGCSSLINVQDELPATVLAGYCYQSMFQGCTSLVKAPSLPANNLADRCYLDMFNGCSKLNYIKALFVTNPSSTYTNNWVYGVNSTGTFVKNSLAEWTTTGVNGIPEGWTVEILQTVK